MKAKKQDSKGIAELIVDYAEKIAKKPHNHWYMGFDKNGLPAMFPEEIGLPLDKAVRTTVNTLRKVFEDNTGVKCVPSKTLKDQ